WRIWSAPAGLINFALLGWFIGLGRMRTALWLQLVLNVANMGLALVFVLGFGMRTAGVGAAAGIAEILAAVAGLWVAFGIVRPAWDARLVAEALHRGALLVMFQTNRDIMIRTVCVLLAGQLFLKLGAAQGDTALAANALLMSLLFVTYFLLDGYANAAEMLVGQAVGARDGDAIETATRVSAMAAGVTGILAAIAIAILAPIYIAFATPNAAVVSAANTYLPWAVLFPIVAVWCFLLDGIFIGATRARDMRDQMLVSFLVYAVALACLVPLFGNHGLWAAHAIFFIARAVTLWRRYPLIVADARGPLAMSPVRPAPV
ncbi:MAG: hypothetical protein RL291_1548, partial [Pseudomonadota bacterium]